jgi:transposase
MSTVPDGEVLVTLGVDTHGDVHVAVALDQLGGTLGSVQVPATRRGFRQLVEWASDLGVIDRIGIEGTGSYGAGLSRWLRSQGLVVVEVDRADRADRRKRGKDDVIDAENAARAVLAGRASGTPKSADGNVEMIRVLRVARRSAMRAKMVAINQLHALIVSAPDELRDQYAGLTPLKRARKASALRPGADCATVTAATKLAMRTIARRYLALRSEIDELDVQLARLVRPHRTATARAARHRHPVRRPAPGHRRRQPRTAPLRELVRAPVRCRSAARFVGQDRTTSTQPRRRS